MSDVTETETPVGRPRQSDESRSGRVEASPRRAPSELEAEGDIAADYIEELLDIADLDGDIDIDTRGGRAYLSVSAGEGTTNLRILSKPDTVNALQELTRIAVQTKTGAFSRLILDVGGSRDARAGELATLVDKAIARIEEGAESASLPADVVVRAQARARHCRRARLCVGVRGRRPRPSHRDHSRAMSSWRSPLVVFHVKH